MGTKIDYKKYLAENYFRTNTELARIIRQDYQLIDLETIRAAIRYHRGSNGCRDRDNLKNKEFKSDYEKRFKKLPIAQEKRNYTPVDINGQIILVLADIHIPDNDNAAIKLAIEYGQSKQVDTVVLLGDTLDFCKISKFLTAPDAPTFQEEITKGIQFLQYLRQEFPTQKIYYKEGNHELRLQAYLYRIAKELADLKSLKLENLLELDKFKIKFVPEYQLLQAGKLILAHGHEIRSNVSCNIARAMYLKANNNILFGHFHRVEEYTDKNIISREIRGSWSVGCLSVEQPNYCIYSKFVHGFAVVTNINKEFFVDNRKIINGQVL